MANDADEVYIKQYTENVLMDANQRQSKARAWCQVKSQTGGPGMGVAVAFDGLGRISMEPKIGRGVVTPRTDPGHKRRWAYPVPYAQGIPIEDVDITRMLLDPTSKYTVQMSEAVGIKYDEVIFAAAIGNAVTGVDGASSETWSSYTDRNAVSHICAVGGAGTTTGFNLEKLLLAKRVLGDCDVEDNLVCFWSPQALEDALLIEEFASFFYNSNRALQQGTVMSFAGVQFVLSTHLPKSSTTRSCIVMQRGAVGFVGALDKIRVGENPALSYENQVYGEISCGAVRRDGERVYEIQITES